MKPKVSSSHGKVSTTAEDLHNEMKVEIKSGLQLIDSTVNSLAKTKFILQNLLEKSNQLFGIASSTSQHSARDSRDSRDSQRDHKPSVKPNGKKKRSRSRSKSKSRSDIVPIKILKRRRSESSSSSSSSSCSTCSGRSGHGSGRKKTTLLLPSPRGAPLTKYKPPEIKKKPEVKQRPIEKKLPKIVEPWSDYDPDNLVENYLETLPWKLVKVLDTKKVLVVEVEDCGKLENKSGGRGDLVKVKSDGSDLVKTEKSDEKKKSEKLGGGENGASRKPGSVGSSSVDGRGKSGSESGRRSVTTKPVTSKLSIFEELLEKTKPVNPVIVGKTVDDVKDTPAEGEKTKPTYRPGPKSKKSDKPVVDPPPAAPTTSAPPPPTTKKVKPKIGPKSKISRPSSPPPPTLTPTLLSLPNAMEIKAKLLNSFREFQRLSKEKQESNSPPVLELEISADEILSKLRMVGSEDGDLVRFGLDVNSKMARFWASTDDSDDDDAESSDSSACAENTKLLHKLNPANNGQFFLLATEGPLRLVRYDSSSTPTFKPLPLKKLTPEELQNFEKLFN